MGKILCVVICCSLFSCVLSPNDVSSQQVIEITKDDKTHKKTLKDCKKNVEDYLYNNISMHNVDCILQTGSSLKKLKVLQVLDGGVLVVVYYYNWDYLEYQWKTEGKVVLIQTNKNYSDTDYIVDAKFLYDGVYTYINKNDDSRTVDKLIEITN